MTEHKADVRYEVRESSVGPDWRALYKFEDPADGWQLVTVLPPGHLRPLGEAVNKAVRLGVEGR